MTFELQKGKYIYCRCSRYRGKCSTPYFREEEIAQKLGEILRNIHVPDEVVHRIEESFLRKEVEDAGFRLREEGTFLRNPNDPRDRNTPEPPQPKDEFVLKFVKP